MLKKSSVRYSGLLLGLTAAFLIMVVPYPAMTADTDDLGFEIMRLPYISDVVTIYAADVDNDGFTDILYTGLIDEGVKICYGNAEGEFDPPVSYLDVYQAPITAAFVDSDNLLDLIVEFNSEVYVMINQGDRTYSTNILYKGEVNLGAVATGYINDDAYLDIVAPPDAVFYGDGTGAFPSSGTVPYTFHTVHISDFNNDGIDDLSAISSSGAIAILVNDGYGNFTQSDFIQLNDLTLSISSDEPFADFNQDGDADFAYVTPNIGHGTSYITIGYGDGTGQFPNITQLTVPGTSYSLAIADVNRDYYLDLIAGDATNSTLEVFVGDGNGNFTDSVSVDYGTDSIMHAMACGDIDRDGNPDFVAGAFWGDNIVVALNTLPDEPVLDNPMVTTGYSNVEMDLTNPDNFRLSKNYRTVAGAAYWRYDTDGNNTVDEQAVDYNLQYGEYKLVFKTKYNAEPDAKFSADLTIGDQKAVLFKDYDTPALTRGEGGRLESDSLIFYYTVGAGSLISPPNGGQAIAQPTFDWSGFFDIPSGIESFNFQLDRYYDFRSPIYDVYDLEMPQVTLDSPLGADSVYYWRFRAYNGVEWSEFSRTFAAYIVSVICGDVNSDGAVDIFDIVFLITYLYLDGPAPASLSAADINNDGAVNIYDISGLIEFLYLGGAPLICP
jgi:hypothetical protein